MSTLEKKKKKSYQAKIINAAYPNGQWITFETDEGVKGVRNYIKKRKWKLDSKIWPVK